MRPLILDFKVSRTETEETIPYTYSTLHSMNMVNVDGREIPFIDSDASGMELQTKTKVHREADDMRGLLELQTKTNTRREADDVRGLLELKTKTETGRERDDHSSSLLELKTKTFTTRESDD